MWNESSLNCWSRWLCLTTTFGIKSSIYSSDFEGHIYIYIYIYIYILNFFFLLESRQSSAFPSLLFPQFWFFFFSVLAAGVHKDIDRVSTWNGSSQDFRSRRLVGFQFINRVKQSFYSQWLMMDILTTDKSSSSSVTPLIFVIYLHWVLWFFFSLNI